MVELPSNHTDLFESFRGKPIDLDKFVVIAGNGNKPLTQTVGQYLGKAVDYPCSFFPDSQDPYCTIGPNVRERKVVILGSTAPTFPPTPNTSPSDRVMEIEMMADAARRGDAELKIRLITSFLSSLREDRKIRPRMSINSALVANKLTDAGIYSIFTIDMHSAQTQGVIKTPWDDVASQTVIIPELNKLDLSGAIVLSPDSGGQPRAEKYAAQLNGGDHDIAFVYKRRNPQHPERSESKSLSGDVKDRIVLIPDDLVGTGGTLLHAADLAKQGNATTVYASATHALLARDPDGGKTLPERLLENNCPIDKLIVTNTIDLTEREDVKKAIEAGKMEIVCVAPIMAIAVLCYLTGESISNRLIVNFTNRD